MRIPLYDCAEFCDHSDTVFGVLTISSSILSTRKRKFSQFFAAAAAPDSLPSHEFANPNAPKANPNDLKSYDHSDLLQYVSDSVEIISRSLSRVAFVFVAFFFSGFLFARQMF